LEKQAGSLFYIANPTTFCANRLFAGTLLVRGDLLFQLGTCFGVIQDVLSDVVAFFFKVIRKRGSIA